MKSISVYSLFMAIFFCLCYKNGICQSATTIKEFQKTYITYPFSDPDPVPDMGHIYPYFRFDGFTDHSIEKNWKVIELENDYIKVQIMPEIGGKIWTAIDKTTGKPFLYNNDVVKFRDIAMRGAWTSGGIEANFGIIGHTPAVATPVDYFTRRNKDGSASCFISNLDLLTESVWTLEIRLPKDKAYFVTHVMWHNSSPEIQPYYSWMNLAVKVSDSLHFIDPGTNYIGHEGSSHSWPVDPENGRDISIYGQNNYGGSKSYHIFGTYTNYFGAYWPEEKFGMIHYNKREDKLGRKVFLWALSDEGKIWEKLLTDHSGQYAEIQSGRLFNQNMFTSSYTPFKQRGFMPYQTDGWEEYWYPFSNTDGVTIADLNGVFNLERKDNNLSIKIAPVSILSDTLFVLDDQMKVIYSQALSLKPLQPVTISVRLDDNKKLGKIVFGSTSLLPDESEAKKLERPSEPFPEFDWKSAYGLYLLGRDAANQRDYLAAENYIRRSLQKDPAFLPSIAQMSELQYRRMQYDSSFYFAKQALSIDTYDPKANFYYGLAAEELGKFFDALDGFELASLSVAYQSNAYTEMSRIFLKSGEYQRAFDYAGKSLKRNSENVTGLLLKLVSGRLLNQNNNRTQIMEKLLNINPIDHFVAFENYWSNRNENSKKDFQQAIRNELKDQTYLNMAIWYWNIGRSKESRSILEMAPQTNEIQYWRAYLSRETADVNRLLDSADNGNPEMVFPFRRESAEIMRWAIAQTDNWKPKYYLALINNFRNNKNSAMHLLSEIDSEADFAPLYMTRAEIGESSDQKLADLKRAGEINPQEWRYNRALIIYYLTNKDNEKALQTIEPFFRTHQENYIIGMLYARTLMANNKFDQSERVLANINVLPFEGATEGQKLYRRTKLMIALNAIKDRQFKKASAKIVEARKWPENLGVGKPFPDLIDNSLEDQLDSLVRQARKNRKINIDYDKYLDLILN